jgi:hypothetical protein
MNADPNLARRGQRLELAVVLLIYFDALWLGAKQLHLALPLLRLLQLRHLGCRARCWLGRWPWLQGFYARRMQWTSRKRGVRRRRRRRHPAGVHVPIRICHAVRSEGHLAGQGRRAHGLAAGGRRAIVGGRGDCRRALSVVLGRLLGVGGLRRELARIEGALGRHQVAVSPARRGQAGLEVALRALSRAVSQLRANAALAVRCMLCLTARNDGPREVVRRWGLGRPGAAGQGRLPLLQRHVRVVRVRVVEGGRAVEGRSLRRRREARHGLVLYGACAWLAGVCEQGYIKGQRLLLYNNHGQHDHGCRVNARELAGMQHASRGWPATS